MNRFEQIKKRYLAGYVTDTQLDKYVVLKVITEEQAEEIRNAKILER